MKQRLGIILRRWRVNEDRNLRDVAKEIGIGTATLMRIEHGQAMDATTLLKILQWMYL